MALTGSAVKLGRLITVSAQNPPHTGTVIFLHGSGDTGDGVRQWANDAQGTEFAFPHLRVLFPTAPLQPYTPNMGELSNVWLDRSEISPTVPERMESIDASAQQLSEIIKNEIASGIPENRIIVGGFSMGGCMALHLGYRYHKKLAGVFALSAFLNEQSCVYKSLENQVTSLPPLLMFHGSRDRLVKLSWGEQTFEKLSQLNVKGSFHKIPNAFHELKKDELVAVSKWINELLPTI